MIDIITGLLEATVRMSIPLTLAAMGGLLCERSGVFNIGLEGMMLFGAFAGVTIAGVTNSSFIGLGAAVLIGAVLGLLLGILCISLDGDQIVVGIMLNVFVLGLTSIIFRTVFGLQGQTGAAPKIPVITIPYLSKIPIVGPVLFRQDLLTYITFFLILLFTVIIFKTPFGLRLRAAGDQPFALDSAGVSVKKTRYLCVIVGGMLAALGGAHLTLVQLSFFMDGITRGRGFIALAAIIFGKWHPIGAFGAALLFGLAEAFQLRLQAMGLDVPYQLLATIPYLLTIGALAGLVGRAAPPAFVGKPFMKEIG
jgi:general nucleoside transport system permease protein